MKPLILEYLENAKFKDLDFSCIQYDEQQNLSIDIVTKQPAINSLNLGTETFTRTHNEESDSDNNRITVLMGTATQTLYHLEASDDDHGHGRRS